ncbi:MAG: FAD-dependent monooxygenase [Cellvibrionaceae bacterium]|nr:FAD-dependent monooxygenase [Cellvibrionaceae bacterium]
METPKIAVVGGGIAGLTAALALAKHGYKLSLYEAAPAWGEVGAGITLAPNAMCGLNYIGVGEKISAAGIEPTSQHIAHWLDARLILEVDRRNTRQQYGAAYVYIHRADLHQILVDAAQGAGIEMLLGKTLVGVDSEAEKPLMHFADGASASADLIVGADGLKSQIRKLFAPLPPYFTGHIAYRAVAPATPGIRDLIAQPGMHIGPGKMVVRYPLRKGKQLNLVFFARQEGWTEDGWSIPAKAKELFDLYSGWNHQVQALLRAVQEDTVFKWAINAHQPLSNWNLANKVTLVGDSAHAMTPFFGQGSATGIEDAIVLARALGESANIAEALQRYQTARLERTSFIQLESNKNAQRLQGEETELYGVKNLVNEETLGLFDYDCGTVAI